MSAGPRLTRRLTLEERETAPDGSGGQIVSWRPLGGLWAEMTARTGREDFVAARVAPVVRWRILVRGTPVGAPSRPRPDQRLREGFRVFRILTVAEHDAEGRFLQIDAEEGVSP